MTTLADRIRELIERHEHHLTRRERALLAQAAREVEARAEDHALYQRVARNLVMEALG